MSDLAADAFGTLVKKLGKLKKKQPWQATVETWITPLSDPGWAKVSPIVVGVLDEMRADGSKQPLAELQEIAFVAALKREAPPHVHTAALWLTDTRLRVELFRLDPADRDIRRSLELRGILKPKAEPELPKVSAPPPPVEAPVADDVDDEVDDGQLSLLGDG